MAPICTIKYYFLTSICELSYIEIIMSYIPLNYCREFGGSIEHSIIDPMQSQSSPFMRVPSIDIAFLIESSSHLSHLSL